MRETWARRLAVITCLLVLALSAAFAATRNLAEPPEQPRAATATPAADGPDPAAVERGRALYASLDCASCHAIAGEGNPRIPLDGVGSHLDAAALRDWIIGGGSAAEHLSPRALRTKNGYQSLGEDAIDDLVHYMASLTE
ncbi:MAG: c-type cytochrome [Lysobacteraceae bacterium]